MRIPVTVSSTCSTTRMGASDIRKQMRVCCVKLRTWGTYILQRCRTVEVEIFNAIFWILEITNIVWKGMNESNPKLGPYYIGVDVGTSSVRAAVVDASGRIISFSSEDIRIWQPSESLYEQSSDDIWNCLCSAVRVMIVKRLCFVIWQ